MPKFKEGDIVKIKNLEFCMSTSSATNGDPGFNIEGMSRYCGRVYEVSRYSSASNVVLDIPFASRTWSWAEEWLETVTDEPDSKFQIGEYVGVKFGLSEVSGKIFRIDKRRLRGDRTNISECSYEYSGDTDEWFKENELVSIGFELK